MAKQLKKIFDPGVDEVVQNFTIESWHVSQSVDAFRGDDDYDITISGSLTISGSTFISGSPEASGNGYSTLVLNNTTGQVYITGSYGGGGATGPTGPTGPTGAASNVAGPQGPQGPASNIVGPQGPQGPQGPASNVSGPQGPQGPVSNVAGPQGPQGPTGPSGAAIITGSYTGSLLTNTISSINWTGSGVQATVGGANDITVYIPGGGGSTDYISDVTYETGSIDFTGVGSAFDGDINISDITGSLLSTASFNAATSSFLPDTPDRSVQFNDNGAFGGSDLYYSTSSGVFTSDATLGVTSSYVNLIKNKSALDWGKDAATGRLTFNSNSNRTGSAVIALPGNKDGARPGNLYISNNHEALPRFFVSASGQVAINFSNNGNPVNEPSFTSDVQFGSPSYPVDTFINGTLGVSSLPNNTEPNVIYYNTSSGDFTYGPGGGGGSDLNISDEGITVTSAATKINFVGTIVSASSPAGNTEVTASFFPPGSDTQLIYNSASLFHATSSLTFNDNDPSLSGPVLRVGANDDAGVVAIRVSGSGASTGQIWNNNTLWFDYEALGYSRIGNIKYGNSTGVYIGYGTNINNANNIGIGAVPNNGIKLYVYGSSTSTTLLEVRGPNVTGGGTAFQALSVSGSGEVLINKVLTLAPQHPLPSNVPTGSLAVSSSVPPRPYMWDGTSWYAL